MPAYNPNAVGGDIVGNQTFDGFIDEVMIFNQSLNSSQALDVFRNQSRRFYNTGEITGFNISGNNHSRVNITLTDFDTTFPTNISVKIRQFLQNGTFNDTSYQNVSQKGQNITFTLLTDRYVNYTTLYKLTADNNNFYTPILAGNTLFDFWNESASPVVECNYTDVFISIWNYNDGKYIDDFGETNLVANPINTTLGQAIWTYSGSEGRFIDGVSSSVTPYTGSASVANCNVTDIAVAMWNYDNRNINGISSGTPVKTPVNEEFGQAVWGYINQMRTADGISSSIIALLTI